MEVKIADFGLARLIHVGGSLTAGVGHAEFTAPEVIGKDSYDCQADIWSFGILIFHVLRISVGLNFEKRTATLEEAR
jgi:serine/threonine protein kinase